MRFTTQATQTARRINVADIWSDLFKRGEGTPLSFNLADDVLSNIGSEICCSPGEPLALFNQEVLGDSLRLLLQVRFVAPGLIEGGDGFVDLVSLYA